MASYGKIKVLHFSVSFKIINIKTISKGWKDEFLEWNPNYYGNITVMRVDFHDIWTPGLNKLLDCFQPQTFINKQFQY